MIRILRSFSLIDCQGQNEEAQSYLTNTVEDYDATKWSDLFVSPDGLEYGISWEDRLIPAFSPDELGEIVIPEPLGPKIVYQNVIDVSLATSTTPGWKIVL